MSSMKNLNMLIQDISMTTDEYEENKSAVLKYFDGQIKAEQLSQNIKDVLLQWEADELDLELQII